MQMVDRPRVSDLLAAERRRFRTDHPRSVALFERARGCMVGGVPMPWMTEWASPCPIVVDRAEGSRLVDIDGHEYVDLCLGDTGAMTGHAPKAAVAAISAQAARGITSMLPNEDAVWVAEEMGRRFGLPKWQFCLTATDANRFAIRLARAVTGRSKILVFSWCYHGTVDETFTVLQDGRQGYRPGAVGPPVDPSLTTRVVEFNDLEALAEALAHGDVACVLTEPALTNIGIVPPEPGFHDGLRALTRRYGTLLVIDETHTICVGPGGATQAWSLEPDLVTIGKPLGSGIPCGAYGMSVEVADQVERLLATFPTVDVGGIGGTLAGNALSLSAMRATLSDVLTPEAYDRMVPLAGLWADGVRSVIEAERLPWHVEQLGCRAEYWFCPERLRTGGEAAAADDHELAAFMHVFALNRGVLLTPFHNMALMSPATQAGDVDKHTEVFAAACAELTASSSTGGRPSLDRPAGHQQTTEPPGSATT